MKILTAAFALALVATPAQADVIYGRHYGPNGSYIKCTTVVSRTDVSSYCLDGEAARSEDRRLAAKNACAKRVDELHVAKWGTYVANANLVNEFGMKPRLEPIGVHEPEFYTNIIKQPQGANATAYAEYRAATKACFTANGFN